MSANPVKLFAKRGDTFQKTLILNYRTTGLPVDLTGTIISGEIKGNVESTVVLDNFEILNRVDIDGQFDIRLTPTQTAAFVIDGHSDSFSFEVTVNHGGSPELIKTYMYGNMIIGQ